MEINKIYCGDSLEVLRSFPSDIFSCVVTSPPYWQLRNYNIEGQIGLESSIEEYVNNLVLVLDEVFRVIRSDGVLFLNISDTYMGKGVNSKYAICDIEDSSLSGIRRRDSSVKRGSYCGIPYRVVLRLIEKGYIMRNVIIWHKPSCVPISTLDRFTQDFEYIYMFVKNRDYRFTLQYEPLAEDTIRRSNYNIKDTEGERIAGVRADSANAYMQRVKNGEVEGRRMRSIWRIASKGTNHSHYATFPEELVRRCLLSGSYIGGLVLDPFMGIGTTARVAKSMGMDYVGIELNPKYIEIANSYLDNMMGDLFNGVS